MHSPLIVWILHTKKASLITLRRERLHMSISFSRKKRLSHVPVNLWEKCGRYVDKLTSINRESESGYIIQMI